MTVRFDLIAFDPQHSNLFSCIGDGVPSKKPNNFMLYTPKEIAFSGRIIMSQNSDTAKSREYFESLYVTRIYEAQYDLLIFKPYKWKNESCLSA